MKNQNLELPAYFIEMVTNNGVTYFQVIRRRDEAILFSNVSLARVAYRLFANTMCLPTYKDGSKVVLNTNKSGNALNQIINQNLVELSKKYDTIQKERAAMDIKGQYSYHLYKEMLLIETEMQLAQQKRDSLILISKQINK